MPGRGPLEGRAGAHERGFVQMGGDELECDRQPVRRRTAWQRDGGMTGHVERAGVALQLRNQSGCSPSVWIMASVTGGNGCTGISSRSMVSNSAVTRPRSASRRSRIF